MDGLAADGLRISTMMMIAWIAWIAVIARQGMKVCFAVPTQRDVGLKCFLPLIRDELCTGRAMVCNLVVAVTQPRRPCMGWNGDGMKMENENENGNGERRAESGEWRNRECQSEVALVCRQSCPV
ncbi:hypothetical protein E4U43_008652 [Claviceps pusilla]|uniref:Uncharacterized protein n=1 Tax=Claviceps pusilla TaxID=123648 RepID=A0A9P7SZI8_9HYPO|nr:hypothetical protein E4U43_008652 [Claviceps pusilla]